MNAWLGWELCSFWFAAHIYVIHKNSPHLLLRMIIGIIITNSVNVITGRLLYTSNHIYQNVALSSEHQPKTPAYASKQKSKKVSSGIYISSNNSAHKYHQNWANSNMYRKTYQRDSCMKGLGSARRRSWGSLTTHLQEVWDQLQRVNKV